MVVFIITSFSAALCIINIFHAMNDTHRFQSAMHMKGYKRFGESSCFHLQGEVSGDGEKGHIQYIGLK